MRTSHLLLRTALAAGVAVALAAPGVAGAAPGLQASFEHDPATPAPGQTVTFTSTTTAAGTAPVQLAWDLDDDGAFDDGTGQQVTTSFAAAGDRVVRLRARQTGAAVVEDVATRTVHVEAPAPPPADQPPAAQPPAQGGQASAANQPPTATIDTTCVKLRPDMARVCDAPLTRVDQAKTFKATRSADPDGQIVRYEWDLDGDGAFERDSGATPEVTTTYRNMAPVTIRLRVTDDAGAAAETSLQLKKLEATCRETVVFKRIRATSACWKRTVTDGGLIHYRSVHPVDLNGILVAPKPGGSVSIFEDDVLVPGPDGGAKKIRRFKLHSLNAEASVAAEHDRVVLDRGPLLWKLAGHRLTGIGLPGGQELNGLRITGMTDGIPLTGRGRAEPGFWLQMPEQFGAPTSAAPVGVPVRNASDGAIPVAIAAGADQPLRFEVPSAAIGSVGLKHLVVTYDGVDLWEVSAGVVIPSPLAAEIDGAAGVRGGDFNYARVDAKFPDGLGPIGPGVYLTRIAFELQIKPKKGSCIRRMGTEGGRDHGVPTFALCGEIGLSAGPTVVGQRALGVDGGLGFATFDDRPSILRAYGALKLVSIDLFEAALEVHTDGYINASGTYHWGYPGWVNLSGGLGLEMLGKKFNATGHVEACLQFVELCEGAKGLVSNKGIVACMDIDLWLTDWHPGAGYRWGGPFTPYFEGCDIGDYRERITRDTAKAAQAGAPQIVDLPEGLPGAVFAAKGATGAPVITLVGPKGERITTPGETKASVTRDAMVVPNAKEHLTQILVPAPSAGRWQVVTEPGSSAIASLKVAHGLEKPKVTAQVARRGGRHVVRYAVEPRPGQTVTFSERGASTGGVIGIARGARGELRFTPAEGAAERRRIVAVVEQDGQLRDEIVVASYRAPKPARAGAVRGLSVRRHGSALRLRWRPAAGATRHQVAVTLSDGRRVVVQTRRSSHVVRGVGRRTRARVAVHGITRSGLTGRATRATLAAARR